MAQKTTKGKNFKTAAQDGSYMSAVHALQECHVACQKILTANMPKEAGMNLPYQQLKQLQACSEICESTARLLLKDGIGAEHLCEIASRICEQCARSFEKREEPGMTRLRELCRQAAGACMDESYRIKKQAA